MGANWVGELHFTVLVVNEYHEIFNVLQFVGIKEPKIDHIHVSYCKKIVSDSGLKQLTTDLQKSLIMNGFYLMRGIHI